jgi:anti-sigma B factor antagonist
MADDADGAVLRPEGKIDEGNWQAFADDLKRAVEHAAANHAAILRVDLSQVPYMSSRGLRALTLGRKAAGEQVEIILSAANARLREILAISRYDKIFRIVD